MSTSGDTRPLRPADESAWVYCESIKNGLDPYASLIISDYDAVVVLVDENGWIELVSMDPEGHSVVTLTIKLARELRLALTDAITRAEAQLQDDEQR